MAAQNFTTRTFPHAAAAAAGLSMPQARALQLAAQGLLNKPSRACHPGQLVQMIQQIALLQIDSIHVVARSPYLVLFSRLGRYPTTWLEDALAQGQLAECWAHEACFVSASDFPWHDAWRGERAAHWAYRHALRMQREHPQDMANLLLKVQQQGEARAADFSRVEGAGGGGWWQWKPEKRWLEAWFALGDLMVSRRDRFARVYDDAERVKSRLRPAFVAQTLDRSQLRRRFILNSVRALGITQSRWIADYYRLKPVVTAAELRPLLDSGELLEVAVQGWNVPGYVHVDHAALLQRAREGGLRATHTTLLSPFDPLVWDRARALAMFDFSYSLECYLPPTKRRYGYYVLPILHAGRLIGRLDAKAHRKEGVFEVVAIYFEPATVLNPALIRAVARAIQTCAHWHDTPTVRLLRSEPDQAAPILRAAWSGG